MATILRPQLGHRQLRRLLSGLCLATSAWCLAASPAHAQYSTSFYYRNPRTGFAYSQNVGVGTGSAYGGFTYSQGGRTYSAGSGYNGHNYYNGIGYANRNFAYSQGAVYGPSYYQGGTFYARRQLGARSATAEVEGPK